MSRGQRRFTSDELALLRRLRAEGLTYTVVAERMGRSKRVLIATMHKPPKVPADLREHHQERFVRMYESGKRICDISRETGRLSNTILNNMNRRGFDREMRAMARAEMGRTA